MPTLLEISEVHKHFETSSGRLTVIDGISLRQREGELISIVGASGSGKTTLLRIVAGLESADAGQVRLHGRPIEGPGPDRAMVFQQSALMPWLTVAQNVQFGLRALDLGADETGRRVADAIARVGLSGFEGFVPKQLSGGMQQRVGIARAIATQPALLLCDEPFASVDAMTRQSLQHDLQSVVSQGNTAALLVTHDIEEAVYLGDRVVVLSSRPARVMEIVDVDLPRPRDPYIRTQRRFQELREHIWKRLQEP
jgi:ABC-type nitrate/sulfonate/bicarbonate transport system ATPase subunit